MSTIYLQTIVYNLELAKMPSLDLIDIKEMAKILSVPVSWIYQRTRLGQSAIPFVKLGKYLRFNPAEVIEHFRISPKVNSFNAALTPKENPVIQEEPREIPLNRTPFPLTNPSILPDMAAALYRWHKTGNMKEARQKEEQEILRTWKNVRKV